jgi:hypothetical protein
MPITHRWPHLFTNSTRATPTSLLNLLKPVPNYSEKDGQCWDKLASWVGIVGAGLYIVHNGRYIVHNNKVLTLASAGRLVHVVVGAAVVELLSYWSVRSPLWFLGMMWLLSKAETKK